MSLTDEYRLRICKGRSYLYSVTEHQHHRLFYEAQFKVNSV